MALLRCVFDAYLRGEWLTHCATDAELPNYFSGKKRFPDNSTLMAALEAKPGFEGKELSRRINKDAWEIMCDFTHAGGIHLQRWQLENTVAQNFDSAELEQCLNNAELFAALSALALMHISESPNTGEAILKLMDKRWPLQAEV